MKISSSKRNAWKIAAIIALGMAGIAWIAGSTARASDPFNYSVVPMCCDNSGTSQASNCEDCSNGLKSDGSIIDNSRQFYKHTALDYGYPSTSGQGCSSCGGSNATSPSDLPRVRVNRLHHYDFTGRTSFGLGVSWEYDLSITVSVTGSGYNQIGVQDPQSVNSHNVMTCYDAPSGSPTSNDGVYSRVGNNFFHDITLYTNSDGTGSVTPSQTTAKSAVLTTLDGQKYVFELMTISTVIQGRLTKIIDRNGNAITIAYAFAVASPPTDPNELWNISTITDAYGQMLTCTYAKQAGNRWCITRIDLPNGQHVSYTYGTVGTDTSTGGKFFGLTGVSHPDGTNTTISCVYDSPTGDIKFSIFDPAAEPTHRNKTVYLQPSTGTFGSVDQVINGAGELSYLVSYTLSGTVATHYVYQGGNSLFRYIADSNKPVETDYATSFNLANSPSTYTWDSGYTYTTSNYHFTSKTDANGHTITYTLDPNTSAVTKTTYPDTTHSDTTYNGFKEPLTYSDRLSRSTHYTYDTNGNLTQKTVAFGTADAATYNWTFNSLGQVTSYIDADSNETDYSYDATTHLLTTVTDPADVSGGTRPVTSYTYDSFGRLSTATDPTGRVMTYGYDARNRIISITYPEGSTETTTYQTSSTSPDQGLVIQTKDRTNINTTYAYDGNGRETTRTAASGSSVPGVTSTTYLTGTDLRASVTVNGNTTTHGYDYRKRKITSAVQPHTGVSLTTTTAYDTADRVDSVTDPYGNNNYNVFDVNDRVVRTVKETVPGGVGSSTSQSALAALARITTANAAYLITDYTLDAEGQTNKVFDPNNNEADYTYDNQGRRTDVVEAVGTSIAAHTHTVYDAQGNVTEIDSPRYFDSSDTNGYNKDRVTLDYTGRNLRKDRTEAPGVTGVAATETWTYYLDGLEATHTDFRGNVWETTWGACCARLQSQAQPPAAVDTSGTNKKSARTYRHNDYGDLTHEGIVNDITLVTFPSLPSPTNVTDLPDSSTVQEVTTKFDARHRPIAQTVWFAPLGSVDANNPPIAGDGGVPATAGLTTRWTYDDDLTDGSGLDSTYATQIATLGSGYFGTGSVGRAVQVTNPNGENTTTIYDGAGRGVMTIDGLGHTKTVAYDQMVGGISGAPGNLLATTQTDALSHSVTSYLDAANRTLAVKDQLNKITTMQYDSNDNQTQMRDPNSIGRDCVYDARNRETQCTDTASAVAKWTYDANSNLMSFTDAKNKSDSSVYDSRDRRTSYTSRLGADTTTYAYDGNNNVTSLTDAESKQTQYTFDARNLKTLETYPDDDAILHTSINDHISYTYDGANRATIRVDQLNQTIGYIWDMASRLTTRSYPDTNNDTFTFDNASRMLTGTSARYGNTVTRTYDAAGHMTADNLTIAATSTTYTVSFGFDNADRNTSITYPDTSVVTRGYTDRNQLNAVNYAAPGVTLPGPSVASRTYDDGMRLSTTTYGNSLVETRTYTTNDNTVATISIPTGITNFSYTYDANKNKTAESDGVLTNYSWTTVLGGGGSGYDDKDRLINWSRTGGDTQTWGLTKVGDWSNTVVNGTTDTRTHNDVHELTARTTPSATLTYDAKGNLTTNSNGQTYTWDFDNRMATAIVGSTTWTYTYDALGRRVSKSDGTTTTLFVSAVNREIAEYTNGTLSKKYAFGDYIDESLAMINISGTSETTYYYHTNHMYCTAAMTDSTGTVQERYVCSPYGTVTILDAAGTTIRTSSAVGNSILYAGRRLDSETGLYYYRARYYDSDQGRFIGRDPLGYIDACNVYEYTRSSPLNYLDPEGLWTRDEWQDSSGTATAECKDTLFHLAEKITGNGNDWKLLGIPAQIKVGQKVNIVPLLTKLEDNLRSNVVNATGQIKATFPGAHEAWEDASGSLKYKDIMKFFAGAQPLPVCDCLGAARLVLAKGLADTITAKDFGALYTTASMPLKDRASTAKGAKKGDWGYFQNDANYLTKHPTGGYQGENVIKVGDDQFWGFPGGTKTEAGWTQALIAAYNSGLPANQQINTIPGFQADVTFFDVPQVGMDVFDHRK